MWPLVIVIATTLTAFLLRRSRWAALSLRISRWTFCVVMPLSLLYFPIQSGFRIHTPDCEWTFSLALAIYSLKNYAHFGGFTVFFILCWAQMPGVRRAMLWALAACIVLGLLVELAEGATGVHHCRMRDLIPDTAGALLGMLIVGAGTALFRLRRRSAHNVPS